MMAEIVTRDQLKNAQQFLDETEPMDDNLKTEVDEESVKPAKATKPKKETTEEEPTNPKVKEKVKDKPLKPNPNTDTEANGSFSIFASSVNGQIAVAIDDDDPDTPDGAVLEKLGFKHTGEYAYARIGSRIAMNNLVDFVQKNIDKGRITVAPVLMDELLEIQQAWAQSKTKAKTVDVLNQTEMRNYYIMRVRKPKDPNSVLLTFLVQDGELFAIVDLEKTQRGRAFIKQKIQGINWDETDGEYMAFFRKKSEAKAFVKALRKNYKINNLDDYKEELRTIVVKRRSASGN
jgi:NTP pyrophosphatase (non-canonical NTP hydrolase)